MYKLCKTEQSARRQRELEEGLLSAMRQRRYEEITISDLCEQMQIPRKSFYRYFSSKDGALHALLDHTLLEFQQNTSLFTEHAGHDNSQNALEQYFAFWLARRGLLDALDKSGLSGLLVQRAVSQALSEHTVLAGSFPAALKDVRSHAISFAICGLMSMVLSWHREGYSRSAREMAAIAATVMSTPMIRPSETKK